MHFCFDVKVDDEMQKLIRNILFIITYVLFLVLPLTIFLELTMVPYGMAQNIPGNLQCEIYAVIHNRWGCAYVENIISQLWFYPVILSVWFLAASLVSWNYMPRRNGFWCNLKVCVLIAIIVVLCSAAVFRLTYFFDGYTTFLYARHSLLLLALAGLAWLWLRFSPPWSDSVKMEKRRKKKEPTRQHELTQTLEIEIAERLSEQDIHKD